MPSDTSTAPPFDADVEAKVLGACLLRQADLASAAETLQPSMLWHRPHRIVYELMLATHQAGGLVVPELIAHDLKSQGHDGDALVADLIYRSAPSVALPVFVERLRGYHTARVVHGIAAEIVAGAHHAGGNPDRVSEVIVTAENALREVGNTAIQTPWQTLGEIAESVRNDVDPCAVLPTGFPDLDRLLGGGVRTKQLVVIAARPAVGKSTLAGNIAAHISVKLGVPGLFISLEMTSAELLDRSYAAEAGVNLAAIRDQSLTLEEADALTRADRRFAGKPLYIAECNDTAFATVQAMIVSAVQRCDAKYVVVDYLQLMTQATGRRGDPGSREQDVAGISRAMKLLAKALNICIIVVAQLNRGPESRPGHTPVMSDLRESGGIEQDADVILLLHRPDERDPADRPGEADVIVAKHRNGRTGKVTMVFQGEYARFASLADTE